MGTAYLLSEMLMESKQTPSWYREKRESVAWFKSWQASCGKTNFSEKILKFLLNFPVNTVIIHQKIDNFQAQKQQ